MTSQLDTLGHRVAVASELQPIEQSIQLHQPQMVLVELPADDIGRGFAVGERIRRTSMTPFVGVGGWLPAIDRVQSFERGAEDVIRLPCPTEELQARVGVVLRRSPETTELLEFDDIVVARSAHEVTRAGRTVPVTSIEFTLLSTFMRHRSQVLSKTQLLRDVWGYEHYDVNLVEVHVSALRRKLEAAGPRVIHTIRGVGYVLRVSSVSDLRALA